jgi:hypothetical protein
MAEAELKKILAEWSETILEIPGVTGVGTASKHILITVAKMEPKTLAAIPTQIEDIPVKIIEAGPFHFLQTRKDRWRPMVGGISIGHYKVTSGTLACMVKDKKTGEVKLLSNNHVFALDFGEERMGQKGDPILQPGPYYGGTLDDKVGELDRWLRVYLPDEEGQPGAGKGYNIIDAAIATTSPELIKPEVLDIGKPVEPVEAKVGQKVRKSGTETGLSYGTIISTDWIGDVSEKGVTWYCRFKDCIFVQPPYPLVFISFGDSGSLTTLSTSTNPVGLVFAGDEKGNGVLCKATYITALLDVQFLPPLPYIPVASFLASYSFTAGITSYFIPKRQSF